MNELHPHTFWGSVKIHKQIDVYIKFLEIPHLSLANKDSEDL